MLVHIPVISEVGNRDRPILGTYQPRAFGEYLVVEAQGRMALLSS